MSEFEKVTTGLGEECGVFGAYDMDGGDIAPSVYYGLFALQHRGQESCGIAVETMAPLSSCQPAKRKPPAAGAVRSVEAP